MKHKTHKGLSKRLKLTGSKSSKTRKIIHASQNDNHHLRSKKSASKKNRMSGDSVLTKTDKTNVILKWF